MPSLPSVFVELRANATQFQAAMQSAQGELKKTADVAQSNSDRMAQVGKLAFAGLSAAAIGFGTVAVKAFMDHEKVAAQTEAVLTSTGQAANVTAGHVNELATSIGQLSGIDDEAVAAGENMLLTFTNIRNAVGEGNDIFDQATKVLADMSVALGTDMSTSAIRLGKALNDPVAGITALTRVGVAFSDQQKEQIKTLAQSGHAMEAQKIILAELTKEFGGSAAAAGQTFAGQLGILRNNLSDVAESVGSVLVPALLEIGGAVADVIGWFDRHRAVAAALATAIGGPLVVAMSAYIAKQAVAFAEGTIATVQKMAVAIGSFLVPATEAEAAALTTAATAEAVLTAGLSVVAGAAAIAATGLLAHAAGSKDVADGATGATGAIGALSGAEDALGDDADGATAALKAQDNLFKQLDGDTNAISGEILKLIGDNQSLDKATKALSVSTKDQEQNQKAATTAAKNLGEAQKTLNTATDTYNKLQAGLGNQISLDQNHAHHDLEQAQLNHEQAQTKLTDAVAEYGESSDEARQASLDLESATFTLIDAQTAMGNVGKDAWDKVNDAQQAVLDAKDNVSSAIDKQREAIEKVKQPAGDMAANTLAWQQAQNSLNTDWSVFEEMLGSHPELREQLVAQISNMKANLPKGADTKPLSDLLDRINGLDLAKIQQASLFTMVATGNIKFGPDDPKKILDILGGGAGGGPGAGAAGPSLESILTGGAAIFGGGAAEGAMVKARPGGTLMLVGEGGKDEAVVPLDRAGSGAGVVINIYGNGRDDQELALMVRDELVKISRNNVGIGLG